MRRRENDFNDVKLKMDRKVQHMQLRRQQCLEFIDLIRNEEKNIVPQIDMKIKHYFNAAFQNLTHQEQQQTQVSIVETRQLLKTIIDGANKTIEVMDRKFDQFLQLQQTQQTLNASLQDDLLPISLPDSNKMTLNLHSQLGSVATPSDDVSTTRMQLPNAFAVEADCVIQTDEHHSMYEE